MDQHDGGQPLAPSSATAVQPAYLRVAYTFLRNSLVRDMTFRANFLIDTVSSMVWVLMNLGFYVLIFEYTPMIGAGTGWGKHQFFLFLGTTLLINSLTRGLFLSNAIELSEHIRNGTLDFILLKPIDTQFLVSLGRIEWSALGPLAFGVLLMGHAFWQLGYAPGPLAVVLFLFYVACGCAIYYSLMIALSATAIWFGRNQSLLDFWFYITNFSRYPMEIYRGPWGDPLRWTFTFLVPVLVAVNVPARMLVRPLDVRAAADWILPVFTIFATIASLAASRWIFQRALLSYRSASS
ncbi:MAG: ABC-2 family transporter protein [Patescibacteria group bacterium]|nr:ABC-2 family transporter protein [Patescibacteria group bacterium]